MPTDTHQLAITTPSETEIVLERAFDAPRELVFAAFTDAAHLPHWLIGPDGWSMTVCEVDLQVGGAWRLEWRNGDGEEMEITGVYTEIAPPEKVVQTEKWGGDWPETLQTTSFAQDGERTIVTQTLLYPSTEARDKALASGMKEGTAVSYDRLATYLAAQG